MLVATTAMRRSPPASVEPGLKPNQPNARMNVPAERHRDVMARHGHRFTALGVLAEARTEHDRTGERRHAADHVHDRGSGEVDVTVTEAELLAERRQPAAAPHPVGEQRVHHHRHEEPEDDERRELPPLGHRAGRDRAGGVHEHHLEEEEREHADVVGVAAQEEPLHAEEPERVAEQADR